MRKEAVRRIVLAGACLALAIIARCCPGFCAWYARRVFPWVRQAFYALNRALPAWPYGAVGLLCAGVCLRRPARVRPFELLLALLLAFCALWLPLYGVPETQTVYTDNAFSQAEEFIEALNRSRSDFPQDASDAERWADTALNAAQALFSCRLSAPVIVRQNALLNRLGIAGIHNPLTGRTYVNADDRPMLIPFTICHELAHQAGVAREDLANRAAWAMCMRVGGLFEDSANLQMLLYAAQELPEAQVKALLPEMKEAVRHEFVASNGSGETTAVQRAFQRLSDGFLRLCGVSRGEKSYSDALLLIPLP